MSELLYKLALIFTIPIFFLTTMITGRNCLMGSCTGNNEMALWYGLGVASLWVIAVEIIRAIAVSSATHKPIEWRRVCNMAIIPIIIIVYILGKESGLKICAEYIGL